MLTLYNNMSKIYLIETRKLRFIINRFILSLLYLMKMRLLIYCVPRQCVRNSIKMISRLTLIDCYQFQCRTSFLIGCNTSINFEFTITQSNLNRKKFITKFSNILYEYHFLSRLYHKNTTLFIV